MGRSSGAGSGRAEAGRAHLVFVPSAAMSSYLFIVKYELPLVIQAFLGQTSASE